MDDHLRCSPHSLHVYTKIVLLLIDPQEAGTTMHWTVEELLAWVDDTTTKWTRYKVQEGNGESSPRHD